VIQNHFFTAFFEAFGFEALTAAFLAIGFLLFPAAFGFLVAAFFGLAGDLAGDEAATGVEATGVVATGAAAATFGFLAALVFGALTTFGVLGLLFEAVLLVDA
jgi:hypothetical protein